MSRNKYITVSSEAASNWIPLDTKGHDQYLATVIVSAGGSLTYSLQYTNDDISTAAPTNIHEHDTLTGKTATATGNIQFLPRAVRLNVSTYASGSATLQLIPGSENY